MDALALYHRLPGPARTAVAGAHGARLRRWRYGPDTAALVGDALGREAWDRDRWEQWLEGRRAAVLAHAARTVPWYRTAAHRGPGHDLAGWPILEKAELRRRPEQFRADDAGRTYEEHTSGTTGTPLRLWWGRAAVRGWYALFEARGRGWHGVGRHQPWALLGGQLVVPGARRRPPYWVWTAPLKQLYLSAWHLSPATVTDYATALRRRRPTHVVGYPSALALLARFALDGGHTLPPVRVVLTNAEPLLDHQRAVIAEAFAAPVRDTYGLAELVAGASECESGTLHLWPEVGEVEHLDGDLVATGLLNDAMGLVRYRTGDRVAGPVRWDPCACGRGLPTLPAVSGRSDDLVVTPDGRRLGRLDPLFKADLPLVEAQVVQDRVDHLVLRVVPVRALTADDRRRLVARVRDHVGEMTVDVDEVEAIERDAAGKFRAVISTVGHDDE